MFNDSPGATPAHLSVVRRTRDVALPDRMDRQPWFPQEGGGGGDVDLWSYWRTIVKHRVAVIVAVVACVALSFGVTLVMTPSYSAATTLQIDREAAKVVNLQGVEPTEQVSVGDEFFQTQYALLKSRTLAGRVVDSLGLTANPHFVQPAGLLGKGEEPKTATERRKAAIETFEDSLKIEPVRGSRLVRVVVNSPDPALSAQVANSVADNFIDSNLRRRFDASADAREFLAERLAEAKIKLENSERAAVAYATSEQIINVGQQGSNGQSSETQSLTSASLVDINAALSAARSERISAEQKWRATQSARVMTLPEVLENGVVGQLTQAKARLQAEYQQKLSTYKPDFPEMMQLKAQIEGMDQQIAAEVSNIRDSLRVRYEVALSQERALAGQVEGLKASVLDLRGRSIQYNILQREVDTNREIYNNLLQRSKEVGVAGGLETNNISVVDRAEPPPAPSSPKPLLNLALGLLLGVAIGVMMAFLLEALDESIRTPEDVESKLGLPLLGTVPLLKRGESPGAMLRDVRSAFAEAYYSIRTAIQFSTADGAPDVLLVTSSRPSEGKSTTALAVAQSFARVGLRVLLVDGDLRNPSMHRNLAADNIFGLSNLLSSASPFMEAVQQTEVPNLAFIPCGPLPPNPAELLGGPRLRRFLAEATAEFDMVVIDGPPVMGLADAPMLGAAAGGIVMVVEAGGTRRTLARTALRRLMAGHARVLGVVLTKFDVAMTGYGADYAYAYDYDYGTKPQIAKG